MKTLEDMHHGITINRKFEKKNKRNRKDFVCMVRVFVLNHEKYEDLT